MTELKAKKSKIIVFILIQAFISFDTFGGVLLRQAQDTSSKDTERIRSETQPFGAKTGYAALSINPESLDFARDGELVEPQTSAFRPRCRRIDLSQAAIMEYPFKANRLCPALKINATLFEYAFREKISIQSADILPTKFLPKSIEEKRLSVSEIFDGRLPRIHLVFLRDLKSIIIFNPNEGAIRSVIWKWLEGPNHQYYLATHNYNPYYALVLFALSDIANMPDLPKVFKENIIIFLKYIIENSFTCRTAALEAIEKINSWQDVSPDLAKELALLIFDKFKDGYKNDKPAKRLISIFRKIGIPAIIPLVKFNILLIQHHFKLTPFMGYEALRNIGESLKDKYSLLCETVANEVRDIVLTEFESDEISTVDKTEILRMYNALFGYEALFFILKCINLYNRQLYLSEQEASITALAKFIAEFKDKINEEDKLKILDTLIKVIVFRFEALSDSQTLWLDIRYSLNLLYNSGISLDLKELIDQEKTRLFKDEELEDIFLHTSSLEVIFFYRMMNLIKAYKAGKLSNRDFLLNLEHQMRRIIRKELMGSRQRLPAFGGKISLLSGKERIGLPLLDVRSRSYYKRKDKQIKSTIFLKPLYSIENILSLINDLSLLGYLPEDKDEFVCEWTIEGRVFDEVKYVLLPLFMLNPYSYNWRAELFKISGIDINVGVVSHGGGSLDVPINGKGEIKDYSDSFERTDFTYSDINFLRKFGRIYQLLMRALVCYENNNIKTIQEKQLVDIFSNYIFRLKELLGENYLLAEEIKEFFAKDIYQNKEKKLVWSFFSKHKREVDFSKGELFETNIGLILNGDVDNLVAKKTSLLALDKLLVPAWFNRQRPIANSHYGVRYEVDFEEYLPALVLTEMLKQTDTYPLFKNRLEGLINTTIEKINEVLGAYIQDSMFSSAINAENFNLRLIEQAI